MREPALEGDPASGGAFGLGGGGKLMGAGTSGESFGKGVVDGPSARGDEGCLVSLKGRLRAACISTLSLVE